MAGLDPHAKPPETMRFQYKRYQKMSVSAIHVDTDVFDAQRSHLAGCEPSSFQLPPHLNLILSRFLFASNHDSDAHPEQPRPTAYELPDLPGICFFHHNIIILYPCSNILSWKVGLIIIPNLLSPAVQLSLLDRLLHRHLSNQSHKTNLHLHYNLTYPPDNAQQRPPSFFDPSALDLVQIPKDPSIHKTLSTTTCLNKKFRWLTLGGQYDWTEKVYPSTPPPVFPDDVASLVQGLFPTMKAQAAIVNLYSPGDTLSLHRDVSEMCDRDLVSLSLGCDGLFIAALEGAVEGDTCSSLVMRLRSGDAVLMSGPARYAWHGVPQILAGTCPAWMEDWPAGQADMGGEDRYAHWKGWMQKKRINLNVRQMWD